MISSTSFTPVNSQRFFRVIVGCICVLLFISLGRTLYVSYLTQKNIKLQEQRVHLLEKNVESLQDELKEATSSFSLEKRVREDLKMQKPGEKIYRLNQ